MRAIRLGLVLRIGLIYRGPMREGIGGSFWWVVGTVLAALVLSLPLLGVLATALGPALPGWDDTAPLVMAGYALRSLVLAILVAAGVFVVGIATAWLVVMYRFWGRPVLEVLLGLPLAMPAYVLAYAYADFLQFSGPVQSGLRELTGWSAGEYWFPEIRSIPGAAFVLTFALYPYVYLTARASFIEQSVCALEVGRTLGRTPWSVFRDVALPLAMPAILAGVLLALMETLADFGAVEFLGVQTFTTGIYRAYFSLGDPVAAAKLAVSLLGLVVLVFILLRGFRGKGRTFHTSVRYRALPRIELGFWKSAGAISICLLPVMLGFALPLGILLALAAGHTGPVWSDLAILARNSFVLAAAAALTTMILALMFAYALRLTRSRAVWFATGLASFNYAVPGSILAIGLIAPLSALDLWVAETLGLGRSLLLSGSLAVLVFLYTARFFATAAGATRTSLARVTPSMDSAARSLGRGPLATAISVHLPVMGPSLLSAALIVFVEVMKELPGTLILRPFNFDTLAIRTYQLASDERLNELAAPALAIVAAGLIPVAFLMRAIAQGRPGSGYEQVPETESRYFQPARS